MKNTDAEIEVNFQERWSFLVKEDGSIDLAQLKKELMDFTFVLEQLRKVYSHITGGNLSKPMYDAATVISQADQYYESIYQEDKRYIASDVLDLLGVAPSELAHFYSEGEK